MSPPTPPPAPARQPRSGLGLGAAMAIAGVMVLEGVVVYSATRRLGPGSPLLAREHVEVELGAFLRELSSSDAVRLTPDVFRIQVILVLSPDAPDITEIKRQVEERKNLLRHVVLTEVIRRKSDLELRQPGVLDTLTHEIRHRLNAELGPLGDGQDVIDRVLFPQSQVPRR